MSDHTMPDPRAMLSNASRAERETRAASRWYRGYLLLMGVLAFAVIVAIEAFVPWGPARYAALAAWALAMGFLGWWAESHDVFPARARRRLYIAMALWFGSYLVVIGPLVRWQADTSLAWWSVAAAVMASPFLVAAWLQRRRS
jgi:hypothetical protein